jgi:hypothetical protein
MVNDLGEIEAEKFVGLLKDPAIIAGLEQNHSSAKSKEDAIKKEIVNRNKPTIKDMPAIR